VRSEADLDGWLGLAGACGWYETPEERAASKALDLELAVSPAHDFSVAWSGGDGGGMASAVYAGDLALLTSVAVLPSARRHGIGRALALSRLRTALERGCEVAVLAPSPDGAALYRALGFETHRQPPDRWFYLPVQREGQGASARAAR
jgi:GNAT superfamily N-acetyltransferase